MMKKTLIWITAALVFGALALTACRKDQQNNTAQIPDFLVSQTDAGEGGMLSDFTGEMDLSGSWQDEVSMRASMEVTENQDGSYDILVSWGSSAFETSTWEIHGTYQPESGMLAYEDGKYSVHTFDENGRESVSGQETTKGSFSKNGEKLIWHDSKNSEDGSFIRIPD